MPAYTKFADSLAQKLVDLDSDTLKALLLTAYTPGRDTHQYVADVLGAGTEVVDANYTTGGETLTGVTWTRSAHVWTLNCDDVTLAGPVTAAFAVFIDSTPGSDATNPVICYWDFGASVSTPGLQIDGSGLLTATGS